MQPKTDKAKQKAKERYKLFKEWDKARTPIPIYKNSKITDKMWLPAKKEYFVEVPQSVKSHNPHSNYVSDKGNVISVINGEIVKRQPTKKNKDRDYLTILGISLHTLVWWSFYKALHNSKAYNYKIVKAHYDKDNDYISCGGISGLNIKSCRIHHKNRKPKDNRITNLLCIESALHEVLHGIDRGYNDDNIYKILQATKAKNAVAITDNNASDIDINKAMQQQITELMLQKIYKKGKWYFEYAKKETPNKSIILQFKLDDTYFSILYDTSNDKLSFTPMTAIDTDNVIDLDEI